MYHHKETRYLPFEPEKIFDIILDIESYPEFIPWCCASRIKFQKENMTTAELVINYKGINAKYTSEVITEYPSILNNSYKIKVRNIDGPFKTLNNQWTFTWDKEKNVTRLDFEIDFEMSSSILNKMIGVVFCKATQKMVEAFEKRATEMLSD